MENMSEQYVCEVCDNEQLVPVLNLGNHPLCDDLIPVGDARTCREYPIEILYCNKCATAHQRYQVPKKELFPKTYHYRSRFTDDVLNGMSSLVDSCEDLLGSLSGKTVLDIGCNDGSLLDFFSKKESNTIGIEPTDAYKDAEQKNHTVYNNFLSEDIAEKIVSEYGQPDIITFTNVFAHIENLKQVLSSLKILMSPTTLVVIENHYLGSILERIQFDTFYHEHPRTYSYTSFVEIARKLNSTIQDVVFSTRYGGNIRVYISSLKLPSRSGYDLKKILLEEQTYYAKFNTMRISIDKWLQSKRQTLHSLIQENSKIPAKAFPGRAAILIKMLDITEDMISCVYEKPASMKINHYLPGTRIEIKSDNVLFSLNEQPACMLNLAWHISGEIKHYLRNNGYKGNIIDILSVEDFR